MSLLLTAADLEALAGRVRDRTGLDFPRHRWGRLERGARKACAQCGIQAATGLLDGLSTGGDGEILEALIEGLTVGETHFYREPAAFEWLEREIVPGWVREKTDRRLRVWVAGCSTGEEACTLAIVLERLLPDPGQWSVSILATDLCRRALDRAREGVYPRWSFRGTPGWMIRRGFTREPDSRWRIDPRIARNIRFFRHNLAEDPFPDPAAGLANLDLVMCRNVLMYFDPKVARGAIAGFQRCLTATGWLLLGAVESPLADGAPLAAVNWKGKGFFFRNERPARDAAARVRAPRAVPAIPCPETTRRRATPRLQVPTASAGIDAARNARTLADKGELREAREEIERALRTERLDASLHYLHALILREEGHPDEAMAALRRTLYLDRRHVLAHYALGGLLARGGERGASLRHLRSAFDLLSSRPADERVDETDPTTVGELVRAVGAAIGRRPARGGPR